MYAELNSALRNERYFYPKIGCGTQKSSQTWKSGSKLKRKRSLSVIAAKLTSAGTKLFSLEHSQELWDCNRLGQILIPTLWPLTTPLFLPKNAKNRAKSNPNFHLKGRGDTALILRFLDSPMAEFSSRKIFIFFDFGLLRWVNGPQSWAKTEKKIKLSLLKQSLWCKLHQN